MARYSLVGPTALDRPGDAVGHHGDALTTVDVDEVGEDRCRVRDTAHVDPVKHWQEHFVPAARLTRDHRVELALWWKDPVLRSTDCWQCHSLRPATEYLSDEQQQAVHRIGPVQHGLNVEAAALLAEVAAGNVSKNWRNPSTSAQMALQKLLKQGLVVAMPGGALAITRTVRFGFFPDEASELD